MKTIIRTLFVFIIALILTPCQVYGRSDAFKDNIYNPGRLKPVDSVLKVKAGDRAADFQLPAVAGGKVTLSQYRAGKMWSCRLYLPPGRPFAPISGRDIISSRISSMRMTPFSWGSRWTISRRSFPGRIGWGAYGFPCFRISIPMGESLPLLQRPAFRRNSKKRALLVIDKQGIIRYIDVHDINERPSLEVLITELEKLK